MATNWNCTQTEERLSDYLDRQLPPDEQAAFTAHVAACERCGPLVAEVGSLVSRMQQLDQVEEPAHLVASILDGTLGPRTRASRWQRWFAWVPLLWQPRFALGVATVVASFVIVFHTAGVTPAKLKNADLSPAGLVRAANRQFHLVYARGAMFVNDLRVVYEIESRLQPAPPAPASAPEPPSAPAPAKPQQKSQKGAPAGRSQTRESSLLAFVFNPGATRSLP